MRPETLKALVAARAEGREIALATRLADGAERLIDLTVPPSDELGAKAVGAAVRGW